MSEFYCMYVSLMPSDTFFFSLSLSLSLSLSPSFAPIRHASLNTVQLMKTREGKGREGKRREGETRETREVLVINLLIISSRYLKAIHIFFSS